MRKKVLYAIAGEGRGHAGRALAIIEQLEKDIDFHFICGGKAYSLIKSADKPVFEIPFLGFVYEGDAIKPIKTLVENLKLYLNIKKIQKRIEQHIEEIKPDYVMSDFEYFTPRVAKKMGIPVIQISHQHVLVACKYPVPVSQFIDYIKAYIVTKMILIDSEYEFGISFYKLPLNKQYGRKQLPIFPPLLRKEVINAKPENDGKTLVYFSCDTFAWVMDILKRLKGESFIVYGIENARRVDGNIEHKPISPTTFLDDLKVCKCVITNGGHGLVSESIHLRKPVLAFHVKGQFEQFLNAFYLDKLQYGRMIKSDKNAYEEIKSFISSLPLFTSVLSKVDICGNDAVCDYVSGIVNNGVCAESR